MTRNVSGDRGRHAAGRPAPPQNECIVMSKEKEKKKPQKSLKEKRREKKSRRDA